MKIRLTGWLVFALTALAVSVLCLCRLFTAGLCVGIAGVLIALAVGYYRHGKKRLKETAEEAAKQLEKAPDPEENNEENKEQE